MPPVAGPLANSFSALRIFTEAVLSARPARYDSDCLDVPWQPLQPLSAGAKLNIGIIEEDGSMPLHPPVKRALSHAGTLLAEKGHSIVPISASMARVAPLARDIDGSVHP